MGDQELSDFNAIAYHVVDCQRAASSVPVLRECATSASLIPVNYREVLFP
jgi:hypothetical protein